jgi:TRAP-type mannitol/chloroaromatic compound transport system permease small subunit
LLQAQASQWAALATRPKLLPFCALPVVFSIPFVLPALLSALSSQQALAVLWPASIVLPISDVLHLFAQQL